MVFELRLVKLVLKEPVPEPKLTLLLDIVGLELVLQQIPLSVTEEEPCAVTFPLQKAPVAVIDEAALVVRAASVSAVKDISFP